MFCNKLIKYSSKLSGRTIFACLIVIGVRRVRDGNASATDVLCTKNKYLSNRRSSENVTKAASDIGRRSTVHYDGKITDYMNILCDIFRIIRLRKDDGRSRIESNFRKINDQRRYLTAGQQRRRQNAHLPT
jgi:hypothetical protein